MLPFIMTVCIAGLCNESKSVVLASDRMITMRYPPMEFEHGIPKLEIICPACMVLTAGDALAHADLCRVVRNTVRLLSQPRIVVITEEVRKAYVAMRLQAISQRLLEPRGWKLDDFYGKYIRIVPTDIVVTLDHQIANFNYGLDVLVAGADADEAHIYGLRHPGEVDCYDSIGYHAIGIGYIHAVQNLIANKYLSSLGTNLAVYFAYEAKRSAEVAPGVGKDTDMVIITKKGYKMVATEQVSMLNDIYESRRVSLTEESKEAISKLPFDKEENQCN